jgi:hypothetical protein
MIPVLRSLFKISLICGVISFFLFMAMLIFSYIYSTADPFVNSFIIEKLILLSFTFNAVGIAVALPCALICSFKDRFSVVGKRLITVAIIVNIVGMAIFFPLMGLSGFPTYKDRLFYPTKSGAEW